jgi:hypothetical protein
MEAKVKWIEIFDQKKISKSFQLYFFSSIFGHQNPGSRLYPDQDSMNPDQQHSFKLN